MPIVSWSEREMLATTIQGALRPDASRLATRTIFSDKCVGADADQQPFAGCPGAFDGILACR